MDVVLEYKNITGGVQDVDTKSRIVTGYLSTFGNKDHDNDIIEKGAFQKSINERMNQIFFLNQHNWSQPHGKFAILKEDSKGLYFESNPLPNTSYSNDTLELYAAGIVAEHSHGFVTVKKSMEGNTRIIREVKLFEGSNVTLGANSQTPFMGFKSLTMPELNEQTGRIMKALRNGTFTDETFGLLEIALKQLQLQSYELGKKSLGIEPEPSTQTKSEPIPASEIIKSFTQKLKTS